MNTPRFLLGLCALLATATLASAAIAQNAATATIPSTTSSAPDSAQAIAHSQLATALRQGGYVIYFRHTATDFSKTDAGMTSYTDCANQRLLSPQGRTDAQQIGKQIVALKLPTSAASPVLASPYCRTMDTATLMLGRAVPTPAIREGQEGDYPGLKALLAQPVPAGTNRWMVGQGTPFRTIAGPPHLAEGEAVIIRPQGTAWTVVTRVSVADWAALK